MKYPNKNGEESLYSIENDNYSVADLYIKAESHTMNSLEYENWRCDLFGSNGTNGISYIPAKGSLPNAFQRCMSGIFFDCKWVKLK